MSWNWSNITGQNKSSEAIIETGGHVSVYKMPERGVFEGSKISNSLSVLASNTKRQWSLWKTFIRPALNSLPAGVRDERWTLNSKIDALVYGVQGATIMVNNDASAASSGGRYWDVDNERPKTIAESFEDLYDLIASIQSTGSGSEGSATPVNLGYLGAFIGMTDPTVSEMPVYSSTNFVTQSVSLETAIGQLDTALASAGGSISLDGAYDTGTSITADAGAVSITVPDTSNNSALVITNNDDTNNPNAVSIANEGTGYSIFLTGTGVAQSIWSDQPLTIGSSASPDGLNIHNTVSSGESAIEILSYSDDSSAEVVVASLGIGGTGSVEIAANGDSDIAPCSVSISASNSGSDTSYVILGTEQTGSIRFNNEHLDSSTWTQAYIPLSGSFGEFDTFKTNFGEVSIIDAINQVASSSGGSLQSAYEAGSTITLSDSDGPISVNGSSITSGDIFSVSKTGVEKNIQVDFNGKVSLYADTSMELYSDGGHLRLEASGGDLLFLDNKYTGTNGPGGFIPLCDTGNVDFDFVTNSLMHAFNQLYALANNVPQPLVIPTTDQEFIDALEDSNPMTIVLRPQDYTLTAEVVTGAAKVILGTGWSGQTDDGSKSSRILCNGGYIRCSTENIWISKIRFLVNSSDQVIYVRANSTDEEAKTSITNCHFKSTAAMSNPFIYCYDGNNVDVSDCIFVIDGSNIKAFFAYTYSGYISISKNTFYFSGTSINSGCLNFDDCENVKVDNNNFDIDSSTGFDTSACLINIDTNRITISNNYFYASYNDSLDYIIRNSGNPRSEITINSNTVIWKGRDDATSGGFVSGRFENTLIDGNNIITSIGDSASGEPDSVAVINIGIGDGVTISNNLIRSYDNGFKCGVSFDSRCRDIVIKGNQFLNMGGSNSSIDQYGIFIERGSNYSGNYPVARAIIDSNVFSIKPGRSTTVKLIDASDYLPSPWEEVILKNNVFPYQNCREINYDRLGVRFISDAKRSVSVSSDYQIKNFDSRINANAFEGTMDFNDSTEFLVADTTGSLTAGYQKIATYGNKAYVAANELYEVDLSGNVSLIDDSVSYELGITMHGDKICALVLDSIFYKLFLIDPNTSQVTDLGVVSGSSIGDRCHSVASDGTNIWCFATDGKVWLYNGSSWSADGDVGGSSGYQILCDDNNDVWLVNSTDLYKRTGVATWTAQSVSKDPYALEYYQNEIWLADGSNMYSWDGSTLTDRGSISSGNIRAISIYDDGIFVVAVSGDVYRYNGGTTWSVIVDISESSYTASTSSATSAASIGGACIWAYNDTTRKVAIFKGTRSSDLHLYCDSAYLKDGYHIDISKIDSTTDEINILSKGFKETYSEDINKVFQAGNYSWEYQKYHQRLIFQNEFYWAVDGTEILKWNTSTETVDSVYSGAESSIRAISKYTDPSGGTDQTLYFITYNTSALKSWDTSTFTNHGNNGGLNFRNIIVDTASELVYLITDETNDRVFSYDPGTTTWTDLSIGTSGELSAMAMYNGSLFVARMSGDYEILEWDGVSWTTYNLSTLTSDTSEPEGPIQLFTDPSGTTLFVADENELFSYNGTTWVLEVDLLASMRISPLNDDFVYDTPNGTDFYVLGRFGNTGSDNDYVPNKVSLMHFDKDLQSPNMVVQFDIPNLLGSYSDDYYQDLTLCRYDDNKYYVIIYDHLFILERTMIDGSYSVTLSSQGDHKSLRFDGQDWWS